MMSEILLARSEDPGLDRETLHGMYHLRHRIFRERLGWEVESRNEMEIDIFDESNPVYVLSRKKKEVDGCWRILPTTGPYMLKDTFPELLRGESAPRDSKIWELSRFAVHGGGKGDLAQGAVNETTFRMMQKIVDFALEQGIQSYVTVTSVAMERLFRRIGLPSRRFGDGKAQRVGKVLTVACWLDVNEESYRAVHQQLGRKEAA